MPLSSVGATLLPRLYGRELRASARPHACASSKRRLGSAAVRPFCLRWREGGSTVAAEGHVTGELLAAECAGRRGERPTSFDLSCRARLPRRADPTRRGGAEGPRASMLRRQ